MPKSQNYANYKTLQKLIDTWRKIVGVDDVYVIHLKIGIDEEKSDCAWVEGLERHNTHPIVNLCLNAKWLQENSHNEEEILNTIVHELLHIVFWDQLIVIDPEYEYVGLKARANEILTMKMAGAIMKAYRSK